MSILALLVSPAFACGGFVAQSGALAASDAQQALFELGTDSVTVTYRARYAGDAADFAWVIAVPGQIGAVVEGNDDLLDAVQAASAPMVDVDPAATEPGGGCGCGASKGALDGANRSFGEDTGEVTVTGSGYAGEFEYTTLSASDADSLATWLTDHGYDTTLIEGALATYVADPIGYEFVAVQLRPNVADTYGEDVVLTPLQITYGVATDGELHVSFPVRLGASSSVDLVRTEMYLLGTGTATLSGWDAVPNPDEADGETYDMIAPDYYDPEGVYADFLAGLGGSQRQMWLAYAGEYRTDAGTRWLTRYDAYVAPATNSVDPVFTDSGEHTSATTVIYLQEESAYEADHPTGAWLVPVGLLAAGGLLRRRSRG